jgi:hypothetical protein
MEVIPAELHNFIAANIETVDQLRILLLLRNSPERTWNAMSITTVLQVQLEAAETGLEQLHQRGLLALADQDRRRYCYQPVDVERDTLTRAVAELDRTRPVTLINLIATRPSEALQAGANTRKEPYSP